MRFLAIIILLCCPVSLKSQNNLVPNGDFEDYTTCPNGQGQLPPPWVAPTWNFYGSSDYFNSCTSLFDIDVPESGLGFQVAHSGNAYCGMICFQKNWHNGREYIQVELTDTIIKRVPYLVSYWLSLADVAKYSIGKFAAYFSQTAVQDMEILNFELLPQIINEPLVPFDDKENWMLVTDTFVSDVGGEKYLTFGNFYEDSLTDTVLLSSGLPEYVYAYYLIDDVSVVPLDTTVGINENEKSIKIYPNPATTEITVNGYSPAYLKLCDAVGQTVAESKSNKLYVGNLSQGLYVLQVFDAKGQQVKTEKVIVAK